MNAAEKLRAIAQERAEYGFYQHERQSYGHLPKRDDAAYEFMFGNYGPAGSEGSVYDGGEFRIALYRGLQGGGSYLAPRLEVYTDAIGSLRMFIESGAADALRDLKGTIESPDQVTALLLEHGFYDRSDHPVGHEPTAAVLVEGADA